MTLLNCKSDHVTSVVIILQWFLPQKKSSSVYTDLEGHHDPVFLMYFLDRLFELHLFSSALAVWPPHLVLRKPGMLSLWGCPTCCCLHPYTFLFNILTPMNIGFLHRYYLFSESFLGHSTYNFNLYMMFPILPHFLLIFIHLSCFLFIPTTRA